MALPYAANATYGVCGMREASPTLDQLAYYDCPNVRSKRQKDLEPYLSDVSGQKGGLEGWTHQ